MGVFKGSLENTAWVTILAVTGSMQAHLDMGTKTEGGFSPFPRYRLLPELQENKCTNTHVPMPHGVEAMYQNTRVTMPQGVEATHQNTRVTMPH